MVGKAWLSGHGALQLGIPHIWEDQDTSTAMLGPLFPFCSTLEPSSWASAAHIQSVSPLLCLTSLRTPSDTLSIVSPG